jgi:hypothetical protein
MKEVIVAPTTAGRRTLYEEAPDEFTIPNRINDPDAGVRVFKRDKDAPGVAYYTELTREELLRPPQGKAKGRSRR